MSPRRVRLRFARGVTIEFVDRDAALAGIRGLAERGTRLPLVVYGPEGCGKSALLRQAATLFEEHGYNCILVDPIESRPDLAVYASPSIRGLLSDAPRALPGGAGCR